MVNHNLRLMGEFFDSVAANYDEVHRSHIDRGDEYYIAIIASGTLHHLLDEEKAAMFSQLRAALTVDGRFIIGDYYVSPALAQERLAEYNRLLADGVDLKNGKYHFDIPTTATNEQRLLLQAGFASVETIWTSANFTIMTARTQERG